MNQPYGGSLINRYIRRKCFKDFNFDSISLSEVALSDLYNIADGVFSPLEGFMQGQDFNSVVLKNKFKNYTWTIPILLDVTKVDAERISKQDKVFLKDSAGTLVGIIRIEDIYKHNKSLHAKNVFGTNDLKHPGVNFVYNMKDYLVGGKVSVFPKKNKEFPDYLSPRETREVFESRGYKRIAGFQTRNVLHRAHEYLQRCALELVDGLFLQPIVGWKKKGDFNANSIIKAYREFIKDYYPTRRVVFGVLKTAMRYAGPKEAVFHAIIRRNFGCTHFIVGRDHAGVGGFYDKYAAHDIFDKIGDIGITILKFKEPLYCSKCGIIVTEKTCGHSFKYHQEISGTLVRKVLRRGKQPRYEIFRPEIYRLLEKELITGKLFYK